MEVEEEDLVAKLGGRSGGDLEERHRREGREDLAAAGLPLGVEGDDGGGGEGAAEGGELAGVDVGGGDPVDVEGAAGRVEGRLVHGSSGLPSNQLG